MKFKIHRPPHLYLDTYIYMLTASTYKRNRLFNTDSKKRVLKNLLFECIDDFKFKLFAWVILDNHYHLLFQINKGKNLSHFVKKLHGKSAIDLNKVDSYKGRKVWYQYWDRCVRNERGFWRSFNYIHYNPVKHGYTNKMEKYYFSSYNRYLKNRSEKWLNNRLKQYPIVDYIDSEDKNF